jgi:hypothetical protein
MPAALVSPLTPFPGISAVVLNLMLIYQPQTAQGGIFLARRSAARLKIKQPGGAQPRSTPGLQRLFCFLPSIGLADVIKDFAKAKARFIRL